MLQITRLKLLDPADAIEHNLKLLNSSHLVDVDL